LRARKFIVEVEHPGIGMLENTGITASLSRSPGRIDRGVPELGQHNEYVFSELLGRSHEQMARLTDAKVID
jgi:crotonobetainyl-CoA:carnitine CoA-transferase CaiB-like acyl-CoA transferase